MQFQATHLVCTVELLAAILLGLRLLALFVQAFFPGSAGRFGFFTGFGRDQGFTYNDGQPLSHLFAVTTLAAVGIAAHEAGHAIQDAKHYMPLVVRNAAVPAAGFGSSASFIMLIAGAFFRFPPLIWFGIGLFACVVFFQVVNLPVEFNASARAKAELVSLGIVDQQGMVYVNRVLNAAAMTYVAATLQAILTLLYYVMRFAGGGSD